MDLEFFCKVYDLEDLDVIKIFKSNSDVAMLIGFESSLELIANGCRPEFNMYNKHLFVFKDVNIDINIENPIISNYTYTDDSISFYINGCKYTLKPSRIEVILNYE